MEGDVVGTARPPPLAGVRPAFWQLEFDHFPLWQVARSPARALCTRKVDLVSKVNLVNKVAPVWAMLIFGLWFVVCGLWFVVCGLWFVVCGLWSVICGL